MSTSFDEPTAVQPAAAHGDAQISGPLLERFTTLTARKRELEAELKEVGSNLAYAQEELLEQFGGAGVASVKAGGFTLRLDRKLWAKCAHGDYARACDALRAAGLGDLVQERFNSQTLSALLREYDRDGKPLPRELDGAIEVSEVYQIIATKAR